MRLFPCLGLPLLLSVAAPGAGQTWLGPMPYTSSADSPFAARIAAGGVLLEDFEDGSLDLPGVTTNATVVGPGPSTDSVDGDDGAVDGAGSAGHSLSYSPPPEGGLSWTVISFARLGPGGLPTEAGVVWTDGPGTVTFEAYSTNSKAEDGSLGVFGPFDFSDAGDTGETAEDRFVGITYPGGISSIVAEFSGQGIELDHIHRTAPAIGSCGPQPREECFGPSPRSDIWTRRYGGTLKWRWQGPASKGDFGSPTNSTGYAFCLYDDGQAFPPLSLTLQVRMPPGTGWTESRRGFRFRPQYDGYGVRRLKLKGSRPGSSKPGTILLKWTGTERPSGTAIVQLVGDDGQCYEADFRPT